MDKIYVVGLPYHKYAEVKDKIQKGDHIIHENVNWDRT